MHERFESGGAGGEIQRMIEYNRYFTQDDHVKGAVMPLNLSASLGFRSFSRARRPLVLAACLLLFPSLRTLAQTGGPYPMPAPIASPSEDGAQGDDDSETIAPSEDDTVISPSEGVAEVTGESGVDLGQRLDETAAPMVVDMNDHPLTGARLAEALEGVPGVQVLESGGEEGPWQIMIRGGDPRGVAVYFDGVLISDPVGRRVDVSHAPVFLIDSVRIYKNTAPEGYPVSGGYGVIDFRTKAASSSPSLEARLEADDLSTLEVSASVSDAAMGGSALLGLSEKNGPGRFDYESDADEDRTRSNNAFEQHDVLIKYDRRVGGFRLYAATLYQRTSHQLPGPDGAEADKAEEGGEFLISYAGLRRPGVLDPNLDAEIRVHYLLDQSWFDDSRGELGPARDEQYGRYRLGTELFFDYYGLPGNWLSWRLALFEDWYEPFSKLDSRVNDLEYQRSSVYFTVADELSLFDDAILIKPRVRYAYEANSYGGPSLLEQSGEEFNSTSFSNVTVEVNVAYQFLEDLTISGHVGQFFRSPNMLEEYGDATEIMGNPYLSPERTLSQEITAAYDPGVVWLLDKFDARVTVFENKTYNRIGWTALPGGIVQATNLGEARVSGVEAYARFNMQDILAVKASYTYQDSRMMSDDPEIDRGRVPGVPLSQGGITAMLFQPYGKVYYEGFYQGERWLDEANDVKADPRLIHNAGVVYYWGRGSVGFKAVNIGDERSREVLDYPLPGTRYIVSVEVIE